MLLNPIIGEHNTLLRDSKRGRKVAMIATKPVEKGDDYVQGWETSVGDQVKLTNKMPTDT